MFQSGSERLDTTRQKSSLYSLLDYQGQKLKHPDQNATPELSPASLGFPGETIFAQLI